jgi:predicted metal-binding membrane protein
MRGTSCHRRIFLPVVSSVLALAWSLGYVAAWNAFGLLAHGLHAPRLGTFQFSKLKYRCLGKCRAPVSFVTCHWRGRAA